MGLIYFIFFQMFSIMGLIYFIFFKILFMIWLMFFKINAWCDLHLQNVIYDWSDLLLLQIFSLIDWVFFFFQIFSVIGLICLTSSGVGDAGYLLLPLAWHLRAFVFVSVCGTLASVLGLLLQVTGLITILPINWPLFVSATYFIISFIFSLSCFYHIVISCHCIDGSAHDFICTGGTTVLY